MRIVIDTSALLSLAAGNILEFAVKHLYLIIPFRVKEELKGISKNKDFEGNLAKQVLSYI